MLPAGAYPAVYSPQSPCVPETLGDWEAFGVRALCPEPSCAWVHAEVSAHASPKCRLSCEARPAFHYRLLTSAGCAMNNFRGPPGSDQGLGRSAEASLRQGPWEPPCEVRSGVPIRPPRTQGRHGRVCQQSKGAQRPSCVVSPALCLGCFCLLQAPVHLVRAGVCAYGDVEEALARLGLVVQHLEQALRAAAAGKWRGCRQIMALT